MRASGLFIIAVFLLNTISVQASTNADVVGKVVLKAKEKDFPAVLESVFKGHDDVLPAKASAIKVSATYTGESKLRVQEDTSVADDVKRYFFDIPIPTVMQTFSSKPKRAKQAHGVVNLFFDTLGNVGESSSGGSFTKSLVKQVNFKKKTKKKANFKKALGDNGMSVSKVVAVRKGNKGRVRGTFHRGKAAKGRFSLKFTFTE